MKTIMRLSSYFIIILEILIISSKETKGKPQIASKVSEEILFFEDDPEVVNDNENKKETDSKHPFVLLKVRQGRQDEDGSSESEVVPLTAGATSQYVGEIIAGVFTGNISSIFSGSANFIGETAVRQNVRTVLSNVGNPLTSVLQNLWQRASYYFGFTTPKPISQNRFKFTSTTEYSYDYENENITETTTSGAVTTSTVSMKAGEASTNPSNKTTIKTTMMPNKEKSESLSTTTTMPPNTTTLLPTQKVIRITVAEEDQDDSFEDTKSI